MNGVSEKYDILSRVIVVGDTNVGKSSLIQKYVDKTFSLSYSSTIGVDFKVTKVTRSKVVKFHIWDTAGQERFRAITKNYYTNADVALIMFDLTNTPSYDNIDDWVKEVEKMCRKRSLKVIIGTKSDLKLKRKIDQNDAMAKFAEMGYRYFEVSARSGDGIDTLFNFVADKVIESNLCATPQSIKSVNIEESNKESTNKKNNCCF